MKRASAAGETPGAVSVTQDDAGIGTGAPADAIQEPGTAAAERTGSVYNKAAEHVRHAVDALPSSGADAWRLADQGQRRVARRVRHQPAEALLLAGAIGYLVGWATSRG